MGRISELLDHPLIAFFGGGFLGAFFLFAAVTEMPNAVDKRTKKRRTWLQRWRLANRDTRYFFVSGCLLLIVAAAAGIELVMGVLG